IKPYNFQALYFQMRILPSYFGLDVCGARVGASERFGELVVRARGLRGRGFEEKFDELREIVRGELANVYEESEWWGAKYDELRRNVFNRWRMRREIEYAKRQSEKFDYLLSSNYSLREALEARAGCARAHALLFFVLGYEAELGERHFICARKNRSMGSRTRELWDAFNGVVWQGQTKLVNLAQESLMDKSFGKGGVVKDFLFELGKLARESVRGENGAWEVVCSYNLTPEGLTVVEV
ncbi:hypothetical protein D6817_03195, partial [Candidatus Pacearchaeota archaeon]